MISSYKLSSKTVGLKPAPSPRKSYFRLLLNLLIPTLNFVWSSRETAQNGTLLWFDCENLKLLNLFSSFLKNKLFLICNPAKWCGRKRLIFVQGLKFQLPLISPVITRSTTTWLSPALSLITLTDKSFSQR